MKWLVVFLVLFLAPGLVQGKDWQFYSLTDGDMRERLVELSSHVSQFSAFANADVMNVQMDVRVFIAKEQALDERTKGHCYMTFDRKIVGNMRDHIIYGNNGLELWIPHLERGHDIDIFIIWKPDAPRLEFTTITIRNTEKSENSAWEGGKDEGQTLWEIPKPERLAPYRALSLDDVCETFTAEAVKGFALPKT